MWPLAMWNGMPGDPGELDHLVDRGWACCASCHTAPAEKMKDSSTMPGQMRLIRFFSGEE